MAVDMSSRNQSPGNESISSGENDVGHTIVIKTTLSSIDSAGSRDSSSTNDEVQTATSHTPSSTYPLPNGVDSSHKRKRSDADDAQSSSPHRRYDYSPPKRVAQSQHMADRALHVLGSDHDQPQPYYGNGHPITTNGHWNHEQHSQPPSATSAHPNGMHDQSWDVTTSTNGQSYEQDVNGVARKRKRNFANRTKTGCLTCRKRKKKCDEARPFCNNCTRGGFTCEGYNSAKPTGMWQPVSKMPIPLQSKEGQVEESPPSRPHNHSPDGSRPYENGQTRQLPADEHDRPSHPYATANASETRNARPSPGQAWPPQQGQTHYTKEPLPSLPEVNHSSHTPTRDMSRPPTQGTGNSLPPSAPYLPPQQQQHPPPPPPVSQPSQHYPTQTIPQPPTHAPPPTQAPYYTPPPQSQPQPEYSRSYAPPAPASEYSRTSAHSRMSSSAYDPKRGTTRSFNLEDVERSKMNRQAQYNRLDATLVDDRKRCKRALARYHAACEVGSGMDDEQARRMLEKVFDPSRDESHNFKTLPDRRGTLSHKVRIETPFHCTYGYNLVMMDSVYIGENTTIDDSAKVEIGPRTTIGANVKIITNEPCKDLIDRKGSQGSWVAKEVFIGAGVVIGDNVIIYPDVRLENGVTVEPGAIVKKSAPENALLRAPAAQAGYT